MFYVCLLFVVFFCVVLPRPSPPALWIPPPTHPLPQSMDPSCPPLPFPPQHYGSPAPTHPLRLHRGSTPRRPCAPRPQHVALSTLSCFLTSPLPEKFRAPGGVEGVGVGRGGREGKMGRGGRTGEVNWRKRGLHQKEEAPTHYTKLPRIK